MTNLPVYENPHLTDSDVYPLLARQVKSYHKHYHMGDNSSVPTEIARELLQSILFTLRQSPDGTLESGCTVLQGKLRQAQTLCRLVRAGSPEWESQYRWETAAALERYLAGYDPLHFAHRIAQDLDYPLLAPVPEGLLGIDHALFYLNCLWHENRLLYALGPAARGNWELQIPDYWGIPLNLCEQPLIQLLGRLLLQQSLAASDLTESDRSSLLSVLQTVSRETLGASVSELCTRLGIDDPQTRSYAQFASDALFPRLTAALRAGDLSHIFL